MLAKDLEKSMWGSNPPMPLFKQRVIMFIVKEISKKTAIDFIHTYHYSKILPRLTKFYLGYFEENVLVGVVTLGWGTQPLQTIKKIFYNHDMVTTDYYEIGKMCFLPEKNGGNFGSLAMKLLIDWAKQNTKVKFIYTMADGIMGKCGFVYQASNFRYLGSFKTDVYMDKLTGEKMHPRSAKQLHIENAKFLNKDKVFWLTQDFCELKGIDRIRGLMFRYIYPLNKQARKIIETYPEYKNLKNPKETNLLFERRIAAGKYETINKPNFNMNVFAHNYQKYTASDFAKEFFDIT
jgi:hypothetical protein